MMNDDAYRAYEYLRKNRKLLSIKAHTDHPIFVKEERLHLNGLVILAEEEVDKVILAHYGAKFGCGTRALHYHLNQIYNKISESRIAKVVKASNSCGRMHPTFSNKGPKRIIQAKQVFERLQIDLVDLSRRTALHNAEVCDHLELIFCEHGTPTIIQTDQGTEFQGLFDELCLKRNIKHIRSRAYHPESQGKVERLNRSWKNKMFYDVLINGNTNWAASLPSYSQTYNTSKHRGLGIRCDFFLQFYLIMFYLIFVGNLTPFFVYFGREAVITTSSSMNIDEEEIEQV
ncbi:unnamed protein product [Rotaria sp. Silwood2]|nr:unnamed protein product [Rotaria sp. Silwood2]CAF2860094.1 unnamed protein product [Rotaria sp. Silwood2]